MTAKILKFNGLLVLMLFLLVNKGFTQTSGDLAYLRAQLQLQLDSIVQKGMLPGITLAVRWDRGHSLSLASGFADSETQEPMEPNSTMFAGSVGKTFVAALVLQLVDEGKLELDALAGNYLKNQAWYSQVPNSGAISIRMLLNHTAGIPEWAFQPGVWESMNKNPEKTWSPEERMEKVFALEAIHEAGKGWAYADSHYIILGAIIQEVTGNDYYNELKMRILDSIGLANTFQADQRYLAGLVPGYTSLSNELLLPKKVTVNHTYVINPQLEWTGGGLVTNVSDLCLWASVLWSGKLFKNETFKQMTTAAPYPTRLFENAGYGLGCFIGNTKGINYYGHTGFVPGYITFVQYLPEYGVSVAMQFNSDASHNELYMKESFNSIKIKILSVAAH